MKNYKWGINYTQYPVTSNQQPMTITGNRQASTNNQCNYSVPADTTLWGQSHKGTVPAAGFMKAADRTDLKQKSEVGNFLLSQEAALQVPSADTRLTAGFGMFPGIPTLLWSPTSLFYLLRIQYIFLSSRSAFF